MLRSLFRRRATAPTCLECDGAGGYEVFDFNWNLVWVPCAACGRTTDER